jgi:hypothetical protein
MAIVSDRSRSQRQRVETRSLPTLTRSYPRRFTFYVAHPIRSIREQNEPVSGPLLH